MYLWLFSLLPFRILLCLITILIILDTELAKKEPRRKEDLESAREMLKNR